MLLIRPKAADVLTTNVPESVPAAWSALVTYAEGDLVGVTTGTTVSVYSSADSGNVGNDPAADTGHWIYEGDTYTSWDAGTTYAAGDLVLDEDNHTVYESLAADNLNHALTDLAWWLDTGASNARAMFDSFNGTVTTHPYKIDVTQSFSGRIDSIAVLNIANAINARVIITTAAEGTVYDENFLLVSTDGISDWFDYFFEDVAREDTLFLTGLPAYVDPTIRVILTGNGSTALQVGLLSIGLAKSIGETQHDGAQIGIVDYSRKAVDDFGNYSLVQRSFSKRGSFRCVIPKSAVDGVHKVLSDFRATPVVWSASEEYGSTLIFGFFRDFTIEIAYPTESLCSIEIEGLT